MLRAAKAPRPDARGHKLTKFTRLALRARERPQQWRDRLDLAVNIVDMASRSPRTHRRSDSSCAAADGDFEPNRRSEGHRMPAEGKPTKKREVNLDSALASPIVPSPRKGYIRP